MRRDEDEEGPRQGAAALPVVICAGPANCWDAIGTAGHSDSLLVLTTWRGTGRALGTEGGGFFHFFSLLFILFFPPLSLLLAPVYLWTSHQRIKKRKMTKKKSIKKEK